MNDPERDPLEVMCCATPPVGERADLWACQEAAGPAGSHTHRHERESGAAMTWDDES
jgi:hypothetical protein